MPSKPRSGVKRPLWTYFVPQWIRLKIYMWGLDRAARRLGMDL